MPGRLVSQKPPEVLQLNAVLVEEPRAGVAPPPDYGGASARSSCPKVCLTCVYDPVQAKVEGQKGIKRSLT